MKAIMRWGGGLAALLLVTSASFAWEWASPVFRTPFTIAPDACGPGWYNQGPCGMVYGPNYYLVPPNMPYNGCLPGQKGQYLMAAQQGVPPWVYSMPGTPWTPLTPGTPGTPGHPPAPQTGVYPTHPYVRGPRDFFMFNEVMEEMRGGDMRPARVTP
jgi:hypothetical protein